MKRDYSKSPQKSRSSPPIVSTSTSEPVLDSPGSSSEGELSTDSPTLSPGAATVITHVKLVEELVEELKRNDASKTRVEFAMKRLKVQIGSTLTKGTRSKTLLDLERILNKKAYEEISQCSEIGYLFRLKISNTKTAPSGSEEVTDMEKKLQDLRWTIGHAVTSNLDLSEWR